MKKLLSFSLSAVTVLSLLASCAPAPDQLDPAITLASSDAQSKAEWLGERLDEIPDDVVLGIGSSADYGIDMAGFETDGYIMREMEGDVLIFGASETGLDLAVRKYAKAAENGVSANLNEVYHQGAPIKKLTVAGNDIAEYKIYYPAENNENMLFAADELQRLVEQACGVSLEAVEGEPSGKYIFFSFLDDGTLRDGGYKYRVENGNIIIEGRSDFGCANAVSRLLQEECGWEGLTYGDSYLPEAEHIDIEEGASFTGNPAFNYYMPSWTASGTWVNDRSIASAKQASYGVMIGKDYCGYVGHAAHAISQWTGHTDPWSQICYTDENVYLGTIDKVVTYVKNQQLAGVEIGKGLRKIDFGQVDAFGYCKCSGCLKVFRQENQAYSGSVIRWTNRISEDMEAEGLTGLKYTVYAYHGSNKPCVTVPRDDVYITFCTDGACSIHPLGAGECQHYSFDMAGSMGDREFNNFDYAEWIEGWGELSPNVFVWYYGLDENLHSIEYSDVVYEDMKFMYEAGMGGVYFAFEYVSSSGNVYSAFSLARVYNMLGYELNWNIDMTKDEYEICLNEILEREYGDGAYLIRECMKIWREAEYRSGDCSNCWGYASAVNDRTNHVYFAENYDMIHEYASRAVELANNERQEFMCKKFFVLMTYKGVNTSYFAAYDADDNERLATLEERWTMMRDTITGYGGNPDGIKTGYMSHDLGDTLEEEAWLYWDHAKEAREYFTVEGVEPRPMPEKWVEYIENMTTAAE